MMMRMRRMMMMNNSYITCKCYFYVYCLFSFFL